jgi:hypothetical protein
MGDTRWNINIYDQDGRKTSRSFSDKTFGGRDESKKAAEQAIHDWQVENGMIVNKVRDIEGTPYCEMQMSNSLTVFALIDREDVEKLKEYCWHEVNGRIEATVSRNQKKGCITIEALLMGPAGKRMIKHKNGNKFDKRKENLFIKENDETEVAEPEVQIRELNVRLDPKDDTSPLLSAYSRGPWKEGQVATTPYRNKGHWLADIRHPLHPARKNFKDSEHGGKANCYKACSEWIYEFYKKKGILANEVREIVGTDFYEMRASNDRSYVVLIDKHVYNSLRPYVWAIFKSSESHGSGTDYCWSGSFNGGKSNVRLHRFLLKTEEPCIDHINGEGLDNRLCNIRPASYQMNSNNQRYKRKLPESGEVGVMLWSKNIWICRWTEGNERKVVKFPFKTEAEKVEQRIAACALRDQKHAELGRHIVIHPDAKRSKEED